MAHSVCGGWSTGLIRARDVAEIGSQAKVKNTKVELEHAVAADSLVEDGDHSGEIPDLEGVVPVVPVVNGGMPNGMLNGRVRRLIN